MGHYLLVLTIRKTKVNYIAVHEMGVVVRIGKSLGAQNLAGDEVA